MEKDRRNAGKNTTALADGTIPRMLCDLRELRSDLRGVGIGSVRQAPGAGAAQAQHLLPERTHALLFLLLLRLSAAARRRRSAAANYTPDLQIGCSPITRCAHTWPTYVPVRPLAELIHL